MSLMLEAIASAWPRSSAAGPGKAPAVSRKVTIGTPSLSARRISRCALRKPSGCGEPKFRAMFDSVSVPFWCPTIITGAALEQRRPADDRGIVAEGPIPVELEEPLEDVRKQVERARPLRVPRELDVAPRDLDRLGARSVGPHGGLVHGRRSASSATADSRVGGRPGTAAIATRLGLDVDADRLAHRAAQALGEARRARRSVPRPAPRRRAPPPRRRAPAAGAAAGRGWRAAPDAARPRRRSRARGGTRRSGIPPGAPRRPCRRRRAPPRSR